jgi:hypothetical protein
MKRVPHILTACLVMVATVLLSAQSATSSSEGPSKLRFLFDDYYQIPRPENQFGQGVARGDADLRKLTNFYATDATAIPNGTFVFSHLIADKFDVGVNHEPISAEMLAATEAFLLLCPIREQSGGRADLTEQDAALLKAFVAKGGMLILVANSIPDIEKSGFDIRGLNMIGEQFGVQFQEGQTDTISIPISPDHPVFDDASSIIFGNGTTIEVTPVEDSETLVLLESHSKRALGPVATLTKHGRGKVLLFGDGGTFGNAHTFRHDIGQSDSLKQLIYALLPDGPLPRYEWKDGTSLQIKVQQEQIISGYPEFLRVFKFPQPQGSMVYSSGMREIDRAASGATASFGSKDFASVVAQNEGTFELKIGSSQAATWSDDQGDMQAKLMPTGRALNPTLATSPQLVQWQSHLLNELIAAPLRPYAQTGETWTATGLVALPHGQLSMTPKWVEASSEYRMMGTSDWNGMPCILIRQITQLDSTDWDPADLVDPAYSALFNRAEITFQAGGLYRVAHYWISQETQLPVHTEVKVASTLWWTDPKFPAKYLGTHDSKNYENWETINFNLTFGRTLTADFIVD